VDDGRSIAKVFLSAKTNFSLTLLVGYRSDKQGMNAVLIMIRSRSSPLCTGSQFTSQPNSVTAISGKEFSIALDLVLLQ
jgi:hypothetical protein